MPPKKKDQEKNTEEVKKKSGILKWIILLLILALLSGAGYFGYNYFLGPDNGEAEDPTAPREQQVDLGSTVVVPLDPFVVNLADPLGRRYLRTTLQVDVIDRRAARDVENHMARVRDAILLLLSSKAYSDLDTMEKKIQLRNEIVERLNQIIGPGRVVKVYFSEFVVQ
ncbi:flagellar basal body-associated FliL family protein [Desulfonatronovibrio hydrogenovorans]|uniref:flagellar basal body-associated FliL family protein n=1 Tax=Desulfonatronovibrio hydrogenovorans TaxID=53245 RepID=UPI000491682C|nr:flagellar basal body-associated FliL family protein [Desulfonatronovibrio hydrogenovorans]